MKRAVVGVGWDYSSVSVVAGRHSSQPLKHVTRATQTKHIELGHTVPGSVQSSEPRRGYTQRKNADLSGSSTVYKRSSGRN